jgi:hypothetical protein
VLPRNLQTSRTLKWFVKLPFPLRFPVGAKQACNHHVVVRGEQQLVHD